MNRRRPKFAEAARKFCLSCEGSQLLEFALTAPLLFVMLIGIIDFGSAYNLKQKLSNAAREGARYGANQSSAVGDISSTQANAIDTVVSNYLTNSGVTQCAVGSASGSNFNYTASSGSTGCSSFSLQVNRNDHVVSNGTTYRATTVAISYPFSWGIGNLMKLFMKGSTLNSSLPATVSAYATVQNIN